MATTRTIPPGFFDLVTQLDLDGDREAKHVRTSWLVSDGDFSPEAADGLALVVAQALLEGATDEYTSSVYSLTGNPGDEENVSLQRSLESTQTGQQTGSALPANCAALVAKQTGLGGPGNRGRIFVPGIPDDQVSAAGVLDNALRTVIQTAMDGLISVIIVDTDTTFLHSIIHSAVVPAVPPGPTPVTSLVVRGQIGIQTKRYR